jgi:hypothetical protein
MHCYHEKNTNSTNITLPTHLNTVRSTSIKILGILWSDNLLFKEHFKEVYNKCSQRLFLLRILKSSLQHNELWLVFQSLIESILLYGVELFAGLINNHHFRDVTDRIFNRAKKIICPPACDCLWKNDFNYKAKARIMNLLTKANNSDQHPLNSLINTASIPYSRTNRRRNT